MFNPFIVPRKKEDVLQELPDLTEVVYRNDLQDSQKGDLPGTTAAMQERVTFCNGRRTEPR